MSYQIITRITITPDLRVMVRMAANNIRPLDFRYDEVVSLTETLRTKGRPTLELELLSLFFKGLWQGRTRYDRAVGYTLLTDGIDKYEAWERCREDKEYERGLLLRMRGRMVDEIGGNDISTYSIVSARVVCHGGITNGDERADRTAHGSLRLRHSLVGRTSLPARGL